MKVFNCAQGTPEWLECRLGLATASRFGEILTAKTMKLSASAEPYCCELIAERLMGGPDPWKLPTETADMRRGSQTEDEARKWHELERDCDVKQVGFCLHDNGRWGCSPDGLIGESAGLELKCPAPKTQIRWLVSGGLPPEHRAQCHGGMIVTGRGRWEFLSYCAGLPPLIVTVERDEYTEKLEAALVEFNGLYDRLWATINQQREAAIDAAIDRQGDLTPDDLKALVPPPAECEEVYF